MDYLVLGLAAFFVSGLTLFSGFGLGTLLMPVFALFFPVEVAVAATAVVHGANNALKLPLFARQAAWGVVWRFGLPAILAALAGAALLGALSRLAPLASYPLGAHQAVVTPLKLVLAVLIFCFALLELWPAFARLSFPPRYLPLGGLLSGFFGGLSGHQGAFRAAFLVKSGLSAAQFVATSAVLAFLVDLARLPVYAAAIARGGGAADYPWGQIAGATLCAFAGLLLARRYLRKVTLRAVQRLTGALLALTALALGAGLA